MQAAIAGFGEGTPQQVSREGQNRRIADFGTVVETCSVTAADLPLSGFPVHRTDRTGLAARWLRLFPFPLKIHFKGRQLPAGRGFFKISFALVIRATGFWQPAGQRIFPFTPHTTALRNLPNGAGSFFWLHLPTTGDFRFCQMDTKKAANLFQTYCFRWPLVGG